MLISMIFSVFANWWNKKNCNIFKNHFSVTKNIFVIFTKNPNSHYLDMIFLKEVFCQVN